MKPKTPALYRHVRIGAIAAMAVTTALAARGPAAAAIVTWNAATADWPTATNWLPATVPAPNDTALVNNGGTAQAASGTAISVQTFGFGSASTAGASASGSGQIGGNLTASSGFGAVGSVINGDGSFASGSLAVGGHLTGLSAVGQAFTPGFGTPAPSVATGSVTVQGDLVLTAQFQVGRALNGGSVATGAVVLPTGTIRVQSTTPLPWEIGVGFSAHGSGSVAAAAVDTSAQALSFLSLGVANQGGSGHGSLTLGSGALAVAGDSFIGVASGQGGTTAQGLLALGGALAAQGANRSLQVGSAGGGPLDTGVASGTGSITAAGIEGHRFVSIGTASAVNGGQDAATGQRQVSAAGSATIGAGGIVNGADAPGSLRIGIARGLLSNLATLGPGPDAVGAASVAGHISGYGLVDIGRVEVTGRANGSLALSQGTLGTEALRIGSVELAGGNATVQGGAAQAVGRLSVTDGAVVTTAGSLSRVGSISSFGAATPASASGEVELRRSGFTGGLLILGENGGQGSLRAFEASSVDVAALNVGSSSGTGSVQLVDSSLRVRPDGVLGFGGDALVGGTGASGLLEAAGSTVVVDGALLVAPFGGAAPQLGRVALQESTLAVGASASLGSFGTGSRAELLLADSTAAIGGDLRMGQSANAGQLFGAAMLEVDASLLTIGGGLLMDPLAAPGLETVFGIAGLTRGLGGYGAIDAERAVLAGALTVDFAGLDPGTGFTSTVFDLITALSDLSGDFGAVQFVNLAPGLVVSAYGIVADGAGEVWRLTLSRAAVPLPSTLPLVLAGLLALGFRRLPQQPDQPGRARLRLQGRRLPVPRPPWRALRR